MNSDSEGIGPRPRGTLEAAGPRSRMAVGVRELARRERELGRAIGRQIRDMRTDAGVTQAALSAAAHLDQGYLSRIEAGTATPSVAAMIRLAAPLGADLGVRLFPGTGPRIRDRFQATMIEALLRILDPRWIAMPEVPVLQPSRGVIDLVAHDRISPVLVACEAQSDLRRLEQTLRWSAEKAASLPSADFYRAVIKPSGLRPVISRLLLLRSTARTRELARLYRSTFEAVYPATAGDAYAAMTTPSAEWPGSAVIWVTFEAGETRILDRPPRGVDLGR